MIRPIWVGSVFTLKIEMKLVGWLGPSRSLSSLDEEKRTRSLKGERNQRREEPPILHHPSFPSSVPPSYNHSVPAFLIAFLPPSPLHCSSILFGEDEEEVPGDYWGHAFFRGRDTINRNVERSPPATRSREPQPAGCVTPTAPFSLACSRAKILST